MLCGNGIKIRVIFGLSITLVIIAKVKKLHFVNFSTFIRTIENRYLLSVIIHHVYTFGKQRQY